jgi:hypothetical protein
MEHCEPASYGRVWVLLSSALPRLKDLFLFGCHLLTCDRLLLPFPGARIRRCALPSDGKADAVTLASVAVNTDQSFYIILTLTTKVTLYHILLLQSTVKTGDVVGREFLRTAIGIEAELLTHFNCERIPNSLNVCQGNDEALLSWNIDTNNAGHFKFSS